MITTSGACLLGRKIMVQVNNLNTPVQVIHQVLQTKNYLFIVKSNIHKIHIHTIHIFDVNKQTKLLY
jgi:hypothetical protein